MKAILLAAVLGSMLSTGTESIIAQPGDPAPSFGGKWINHPTTTLQDLAGRIVFIEVWRTW